MNGFLSYAARRLLRLPGVPLSVAAQRTYVLHPASRQRRPLAFFLEGQLERIESVQDETTRDKELARVLGSEVEHAEVVMHELSDVTVTGGSAYSSGCRVRLMPGKPGSDLFRFSRQEI